MYVMRFTGTGPGDFMEYSYSESIKIKKGIAVVREWVSRDYLENRQFKLLGEIDDLSQLEAFLAEGKKPEGMLVKVHEIKVEEVIAAPGPIPVPTEEAPGNKWWRE